MADAPNFIQEKLDAIRSQINRVMDHARAKLVTEMPQEYFLRIGNSSPAPLFVSQEDQTHQIPLPFLTPTQVAQAINFVTRYEFLPKTINEVSIVYEEGAYHIKRGQLAFYKHVLNDFRPLIHNVNDSVHHARIHRLCRRIVSDSHQGTTVRVRDGDSDESKDITETYLKWLNEHKDAITLALGPYRDSFRYLYNGILQHSNETYTDQFLEDYKSGELNYVLIKHAYVLNSVRKMMTTYYQLLSQFAFPTLGPL